MDFNEDLQQYVIENENILFAWDEEPEDDYIETVKKLTKNYYDQLDSIIEFMLPDLIEMYGPVESEEVKGKLGKPLIEQDRGQLMYLEHTFDYEHIFTIEYSDDEFKALQYFVVDG